MSGGLTLNDAEQQTSAELNHGRQRKYHAIDRQFGS